MSTNVTDEIHLKSPKFLSRYFRLNPVGKANRAPKLKLFMHRAYCVFVVWLRDTVKAKLRILILPGGKPWRKSTLHRFIEQPCMYLWILTNETKFIEAANVQPNYIFSAMLIQFNNLVISLLHWHILKTQTNGIVALESILNKSYTSMTDWKLIFCSMYHIPSCGVKCGG